MVRFRADYLDRDQKFFQSFIAKGGADSQRRIVFRALAGRFRGGVSVKLGQKRAGIGIKEA
jgi:hypothetical protein